jgi:hypothetical protein
MTRIPRLSVRLDDDLSDDLATVTRTGVTASDAVRLALALLANTYRCAWDHGDVPDDQAPRILGVRYATADGTPAPEPHTPTASYAQADGGVAP